MQQRKAVQPTLCLTQQIQLLGSSNNQIQNQQNIPQINRNTFSKNSRRDSSNSSLKSHSHFDQNQFRLYAITSKKTNRIKLSPQKNPIDLLSNFNNTNTKLNKSKKSHPQKRKSESGILLGFNKIQHQDAVKQLYHQYLTMEQLQTKKAKQKLEKKILKFMPKNSSFSQFYGQKIRMDQKEAQRQQSEINKEIFTGNPQDRIQKEKQRKIRLKQILQNKAINFNNRLRNRSYQKEKQGPSINVMETIQRDNTRSHLDVMNSPTYSDLSQFKLRFQFFPEPKDLRFTRIQAPHNGMMNKISRSSSRINNQKQSARQDCYMDTIKRLQEVSQRETKRSQYLIGKSRKKQEEFKKQYDQLNNQTLEAIYGFTETKLEEQTSHSFRDELREMWMNNDMNKGKSKRSSIRGTDMYK